METCWALLELVGSCDRYVRGTCGSVMKFVGEGEQERDMSHRFPES